MTIIMYDLAGAELDRRISPYCWRAHMALAHKGFEVETVPCRFLEKDKLPKPNDGKVPIIVDAGRVVHDSWASLDPFRRTLERQQFIAGEAPAYADYIVFGDFQWARTVSDFEVLAADDPVRTWRGRMLDLFDGLARRVPGYGT